MWSDLISSTPFRTSTRIINDAVIINILVAPLLVPVPTPSLLSISDIAAVRTANVPARTRIAFAAVNKFSGSACDNKNREPASIAIEIAIFLIACVFLIRISAFIDSERVSKTPLILLKTPLTLSNIPAKDSNGLDIFSRAVPICFVTFMSPMPIPIVKISPM